MKAHRSDTLPTWLQWSVFAGLGLILVAMPFHAFLSTWAGSAWGSMEIWKSWKELLLILLAIPALTWLLVRPRRMQRLFQDPLGWWLAAYVLVAGCLAAIHVQDNGTMATLAGLAMSLRYMVIFALGYVIFLFGEWEWSKIRRYAAGYIMGIGIFVALLGIVQVTLLPNEFLSQFGYDKGTTIAPYLLIDENPAAPRAFATLRGPNDFGAYLVLPFVLTLIAARRHWAWLIGSGVIALAIFESASRSAWIGTILAFVALLVMTYGRGLLTSRKVRAGLVCSALVVGVIGFAAVSIPSVRLEVFHSSPGDESLIEGSTANHWAATAGGVQRALSEPTGCGPGCAGPASYYGDSPKISENYYVQIAEEFGLSGIILWIGIVVMVIRRLWRVRDDYLARGLLATLAGVSLIGVWLHVWSDDPLALTWWLLAGSALGYYASIGYDEQKGNRQKTNNDRHTKEKTTPLRR